MIIDDLPPPTLTPRYTPPKVKIEFKDQNGAKYSFAVEGPSKHNIGKLMDFIESISPKDVYLDQTMNDSAPDTNFNKVLGLLQNKFRFGSFTSSDVLQAYEEHFQLHTTLSTISTYLSRLAERRFLSRYRKGSGWIYKLLRQDSLHETTTEQPLPNYNTPLPDHVVP